MGLGLGLEVMKVFIESKGFLAGFKAGLHI